MLRVILLLAVTAWLLAACTQAPLLETRPAVNANGVDLSGDWALRGASAAPPRPFAEGEQPFRIPPRATQRPQRSKRAAAPAVGVFLENGRALRISQTNHGLFISFDRAVVEEYTFGENRLVSVGPIEAQRVSGWEGNAFVIETMDEEGTRLSETWSLTDTGATLVRRIVVTRRDEEEFSTEQLFDRE